MNKALRSRYGFTYQEAAYLTFHMRELAEHLLNNATLEEVEQVRAMLQKMELS